VREVGELREVLAAVELVEIVHERGGLRAEEVERRRRMLEAESVVAQDGTGADVALRVDRVTRAGRHRGPPVKAGRRKALVERETVGRADRPARRSPSEVVPEFFDEDHEALGDPASRLAAVPAT
jgi:hypothetical protein